MANNQLIQGAGAVSKEFLDVGKAVGEGFAASNLAAGLASGRGSNSTPAQYVDSTIAKNKSITARVNKSMSKMKTDMDFTSFSPAETKSMRNFLVGERAKYAEAAKLAAEYSDPTDPRYMEQVDIMQGVNNSFMNLAKQLESYKKSKLDYAKNQKQGIYSNGTNSEVARDNAIMYGFYDKDGDGVSDGQYDSPFTIQEGGNIGFNIKGKTIDYNNAPSPIIKDYKLATSILKGNEQVYKSGVKISPDDPSMKSYRLQLEQSLADEDSLISILYDYEDELPTGSILKRIDSGELDLTGARTELVNLLSNARVDVSNKGYSAKQSRELVKKREGGNVVNNKTPEWIALKEKQLRSIDNYQLVNGRNYVEIENFKGSNTTKKLTWRVSKSPDDGVFYYKLPGGVEKAISKEDLEKELGIKI